MRIIKTVSHLQDVNKFHRYKTTQTNKRGEKNIYEKKMSYKIKD